jgi:hypothetical protein
MGNDVWDMLLAWRCGLFWSGEFLLRPHRFYIGVMTGLGIKDYSQLTGPW